MSFGSKTGFSVRDILDLPNPTGRCGSGAKETEEDDTEEASAEASRSERAETVRLSGGRFCESGCGSYGRWSSGSGNLHFSREETFIEHNIYFYFTPKIVDNLYLKFY